MISEIKAYFKNLIAQETGLSDQYIFLSLKDEAQYKTGRWASILSGESEIQTVFSKEQVKNQDGTIKLMVRKYTVVQKLAVAVSGKTEKQVSDWILSILQKADRGFTAGGVFLKISPLTVEYSDNASVMSDSFIGKILFECEYPVISENPIPVIPSVDISVSGFR
ncbi:MAG TPA: hypothetical protein DHW82_14240 [Spirochaetia bacterium]|nr:MAG: hypothetical protein A2Y41_00380 [Spirochaetes bacterium GWB1_36_13]HCL58150.1 hypothetical protein [Spirochaetia bacterium]